ncbi:MAG: histidine phosphatase family protein [Bacteroidota bacterium]|nr:histidine phosphatase family protein [Bacteroidota bacterium]
MRHAKSDWSLDLDSDFERPLNKRGKKDAPRMGKEMLDRKIVPDHILASTAKRAVETVEAVVKACAYQGKINYFDDFYSGNIDSVFEQIQKLDNLYGRVLLIGHNPTWESLSELLISKDMFIEMPTSTLVSVNAYIDDWKKLEPKSCKFNWLIKPRELMEF